MLKKLFFVVLIVLAVILSHPVYAKDEYRNDYAIDYFLSSQGNSIATTVKYSIKLTNLKEDLYIDKYQISFPSSFKIHNISASDDKGTITPDVTTDSDSINIKMKLNEPKIGKDTQNNLNVQFEQDNLFNVNGNIWEVIIPTMPKGINGSSAIRVHLPRENKKLSIAKPVPTRIEDNVIYWDNPVNKTIYAIFGDKQNYSLDLIYHLQNDQKGPVYTEIALPPDTLYQKVITGSIEPAPVSVRIDEDGNYLARYDLAKGDKTDIHYKGFVQVYTQPRDELRQITKTDFNQQKSYLLQGSKYWTISNAAAYAYLKTPQNIFKSVVGTLSYDYSRVNKGKSKRLGAELALKNPTKAVCSEFTDSFIALARSGNIYAREIEGFGFSQDEKLRPFSLASDVLHSWPEYYDQENNIWKQVDPTWENTSGIDFFSSFDLDHIAFAIHGKSPEDPPPAGTYKTMDTKDVDVTVSKTVPEDNVALTVKNIKTSSVVSDKQTNQGSADIVNKGNVTAYNVTVTLGGSPFTVTPDKKVIDRIPPYGTQTINFTYTLKTGLTPKEGSITVNINGQSSTTQTVRIVPFAQTITVLVSGLTAVFLLVLLIAVGKHRKSSV